MRFAIGEIVIDVVVDDDDFELPLSEFLPELDLPALSEHRGCSSRISSTLPATP
jgi:hypothetical protein